MLNARPLECTNEECDLNKCSFEKCQKCHWNRSVIDADKTDISIETVRLIKDSNGIYRYRRVNKNDGVV